tara:strand:- start:2654 stop:3907 length:1254 start_codon:yes stop_codon:yes gene_type:complete
MASSLYSYTQNNESGSDADVFGPKPGGSNRDLLNAITLVDAKECPFMAMVPKAGGVTNLNFEWPVDKELTADDNAAIDGHDLQHGFSSTNTGGSAASDFGHVLDEYAIMENRVQWFRRAALVSKLTESATNLAGVANQRAYAVRKQLLALKRDMEVRLCADSIPSTGAKAGFYNAGKVTGDSTKGNKTASLGAFIDDGDTAGLAPAGYTTPAASVFDSDPVDNDHQTVTNGTGTDALRTTATLTEDQVNAVLQSIYEQTGKISTKTMLCGPNLKKRFKDYTAVSTGSAGAATVSRSYGASLADKKVISTVDVYEGDFGTLQLVPTLWNAFNFGTASESGSPTKAVSWSAVGATGAGANPNLSYGYVLDMDLLELRFHQLPQVQPLPNQGAGERFAVDAIAGLCVKNPLGLGAFKMIK